MTTAAHDRFPMLFSPISLRHVNIRNRILSTGHQTYLGRCGMPTDELAAYHEARARGGAGLIIVESARFHESSFSDAPDLHIHKDDCIPAYRNLSDAAHRHGARIFGQLSHSGRVSRRMHDGLRGVAYGPSATPDNRFHTIPRAMSLDMIEDLTAAVGHAARRYAEAGFDGAEILASHGLLFAQFLNPKVNRRTDAYGGSRENRLRFLADSLAAARRSVGDSLALGIRISIEEVEADGLTAAEVMAICRELVDRKALDYVNVTMGSLAGLGGSVHVVPPMEIGAAYVAPKAAALRDVLGVPVLVAGRINQPQIAEQVLASGQADMCGMTRAMISDPDMPRKAHAGRLDEIRACIGCNQACIGHFHQGRSISCIQNPVSGRELTLGSVAPTRKRGRVLVAGGGPAGMKAAITAAERGHEVTLCEAAARLGGQALLAQLIPDRAEFGGLVTNLEQELRALGVTVLTGTRVTSTFVGKMAPDAIIVATGASPQRTAIEGREEGHVVEASDVLSAAANPGSRVLVADWACDWVGMGTALHLARKGHHVRLAVNGICAGQNVPIYVRDHWAGQLHGLGVEVISYARIFGVGSDTAYLTHIVTGAPIVCGEIDTVVTASGRLPRTELEDELAGLGIPILQAGDCLSPRSAEEAVYEGLLAGRNVLPGDERDRVSA